MPGPWNGWYHCIGTTHGAWLRGDQRGWRARHHREHVLGDYKQPPPEGMYADVYRHSLQIMTQDAVVLEPEARPVIAAAFRDKLKQLGVEVARLCVGGCHFHILMRIESPRMAMRGLCAENALRDGRNPLPRHVVGMAKKHASHRLRELELKRRGTLWAKRPKFVPIESEGHFLWVRDRYIPDHVTQGAVVMPAV